MSRVGVKRQTEKTGQGEQETGSGSDSALLAEPTLLRCPWVPAGDALYIAYHDGEWGVPLREDRDLFELLVLEGAQAGLNWRSILARRAAYRRAFCDFVPEEVASFGPARIESLLADPGIIRNRAKIESTVGNARALLDLREQTGSTFSTFLWTLVGGCPVIGHVGPDDTAPAETPISRTVSQALKKAGFRFVGPVIVQSYLEASGLLMDHVVSCFRYEALAQGETGA